MDENASLNGYRLAPRRIRDTLASQNEGGNNLPGDSDIRAIQILLGQTKIENTV